MEALQVAARLSEPVWVITHDQYGGRGRHGRAWVMPRGNFAGSFAFRTDRGARQAALYSFVAALALYDTLSLVSGPAVRLALKWPNDVLLNGGKVAGILLESRGQEDALTLVVGIGVNLAAAPAADKDTVFVPVSVKEETGILVTPEDFLDVLAPVFSGWEKCLLDRGFQPVRDAFLSRAARLGQAITARTSHGVITGCFEGIDTEGALVLVTAEGRQTIQAADVYF